MDKEVRDMYIALKQGELPHLETVLSYLQEEMTEKQKKKREEIVMELKKKADEFKEKYGKDWEKVIYATATKLALGEK